MGPENSIWELLETQTLRPPPEPSESESVFYQDAQVLCVHMKVWKVLLCLIFESHIDPWVSEGSRLFYR